MYSQALPCKARALAGHQLNRIARTGLRRGTTVRITCFKEDRQMATSTSRGGAPPAGAFTSKVPGTRANPWLQHELEPKYPSLSQDLTTDVCVIGAGLAGLTTAYRLVKAGKRVVVLESRVRGSGDAGRSTGMITPWSTAYYANVEKVAGRERARVVAEANQAALTFIGNTVKEERINCGYSVVPGYLTAHRDRGEWPTSEGEALVKKELEACQRLGFPAHYEQVPEGSSGYPEGVRGAMSFGPTAVLNPVQYMEGLADAVVRHGGQIFELTRAEGGVVTGPAKGIVKTFTGHTVTAREGVVLATHSPINRDQLWVHDRQLPKRSYIIALEVPARSVREAQWFDTSPNPHSVRVVSADSLSHLKGSSGVSRGMDLLLVQGEAHHHGIGASKYWDTWGELEKWARRMFPKAGRVVYSWSTMEYDPADLLGLYGVDPIDWSHPRNYILTGHSHDLFTGCTTGSDVVASMILGNKHPWHDVFKPSRFLPGAITKYTTELTQYFSTVGIALAKHVVPRSLQDVKGLLYPSAVESDIKPGEGVVAQHGWRKKALYRDEEGTLHMRSALCTHLGCCVEWNPADRTFDCPCHGSEFDACGRCIHAPAVADLEDLGTKPYKPGGDNLATRGGGKSHQH